MIATQPDVSILLLERLCRDLHAHIDARTPVVAQPHRVTTALQRVTSRASLLISIAGAAIGSLLDMTMYR